MTAKGSLFIITLFVVLLVFVFGAFLIPDVMRQSLTTIFYTAAFGLVALLIIIIGYTSIDGIERIRTRRAERKKVQHDAEIMVIDSPHDHRVIVHELSTGIYRNMTMDSRWTISAAAPPPSELEVKQWGAYHQWLQPRVVGRDEAQLLANPDDVPNLLNTITDYERMLIVGGSDSGKTTLLQHIVSRRQGDIVIIDPHNDGVTWPDNAQVLGSAQDYQEAEKAIVWVMAEIQRRYQERFEQGKQPHEFTPLTLLIDEWRELVMFGSKPMLDGMKRTLTGGRKVSACIALAGHSERVEALGIKGEGDLKDGFAVIRLKGNRHVGFNATLDIGDGQIPVVLPGPYVAQAGGNGNQIIDTSRVALPASGKEQQILRLWDKGIRSVTRIGAQVYHSKGGQQNDLVRDVLARHGRV